MIIIGQKSELPSEFFHRSCEKQNPTENIEKARLQSKRDTGLRLGEQIAKEFGFVETHTETEGYACSIDVAVMDGKKYIEFRKAMKGYFDNFPNAELEKLLSDHQIY